MNRDELQKLYMDYLVEEGYKASSDDDGDIEFKYEGDLYIMFVDEKDTEYFRIQSGCGLDLDTEDDKYRALQAASMVNAEYKLGKIFIRLERGVAIVETGIFLVKPEDFKMFFKRCLGILQGMLSDFFDKLKEDVE